MPSAEERGSVVHGASKGEPTPPPEPSDSIPGVSRRLVAWVADILAVVVVVLIAAAIVSLVLGPTVVVDRDAPTAAGMMTVNGGLVVLNTLLSVGLSAAYFVIPWTSSGSSPGQRLLKIQVRSATGPGKLGLRRALVRWALLFPPFGVVSAMTAGAPVLSAAVWASAPLWYLVLLVGTLRNPAGQGLHDRIARSVVRFAAARPVGPGAEATHVR